MIREGSDVSSWASYADRIKRKIQKSQDERIYPLAYRWKTTFEGLYQQNDARVHWFIGVARMTNNLKLGYISLQTFGDIRSWPAITEPPIPSESDIKDLLREFETFIFWAYLHGLCTITEETFRRIYQMMGNKETDDFQTIYDHLLTKTEKAHFTNLFDLFRNIRNMAHQNGTFLPRTKNMIDVIEWKGTRYTFNNEKGVDSATASFFIDVLTGDLCTAMDEIMGSPEIIQLPVVTGR